MFCKFRHQINLNYSAKITTYKKSRNGTVIALICFLKLLFSKRLYINSLIYHSFCNSRYFHLLVLFSFNNQVNLKYMGESMVRTSFYGNLGLEELTILKSKICLKECLKELHKLSIYFLVYICFFKRQRDVSHSSWDPCNIRQTKVSGGITLQLRHCPLQVVTTTMWTIHRFYGLLESPITWPLIPSWRL